MTVMRAKMQVHGVQEFKDANGNVTQENLILYPVAKDGGYPSDGSDEDNSFARWTPSGELKLTIQRDRVRAHRRRAGRSARAAGRMTTDTDPDIDAQVVEDLARRLEGAFRWVLTPQGHEYWAAVADNLRATVLDQLAAA